MNPPLLPLALGIAALVGLYCLPDVQIEPKPQEPDLALAADQLSRLAPVVDMGKVEPVLPLAVIQAAEKATEAERALSFSTIAPFEITATQDITVTVLKMWSECRSPLDQRFECAHGGKVWRTEWREVKP